MFSQEKEASKHPELGSHYKGRLLLSLRVSRNPHGAAPERVHKRYIPPRRANATPRLRTYVLHAFVATGTDMPCIASKVHIGRARRLHLRVCMGNNAGSTRRAFNEDGAVSWMQALTLEGMRLPADVAALPDVFMYVMRGKGRAARAVSYLRFQAADLLQRSRDADPAAMWLPMHHMPDAGADRREHSPGLVLAKLWLGSPDEAPPSSEWIDTVQAAALRLCMAQVRVRVYQARHLPAADASGACDPYVVARVAGKRSGTKWVPETTEPLWYEVLTLTIITPVDLEYAPPVTLQVRAPPLAAASPRVVTQRVPRQVWDHNKVQADTELGVVRIPLAAALQAAGAPFDTPACNELLPDPEWMPLLLPNGEPGQGELLVSVEIVCVESPSAMLPPPKSIVPAMRPAWVEVTTLGLRDLKPLGFMRVAKPYASFDLGDRSLKESSTRTAASNTPSATQPNMLEVPAALHWSDRWCPHQRCTLLADNAAACETARERFVCAQPAHSGVRFARGRFVYAVAWLGNHFAAREGVCEGRPPTMAQSVTLPRGHRCHGVMTLQSRASKVSPVPTAARRAKGSGAAGCRPWVAEQ